MSQPRLETQTAQPYVKGSEYPMTLVYSDGNVRELVTTHTGKGFIQGKSGYAFIDRDTNTLVVLTSQIIVGKDRRITAQQSDFIQRHLTQAPEPAPIYRSSAGAGRQ